MIKYVTDVKLMKKNNKNISNFFFEEIQKKGKYTISINNNKAIITPREEEKHYKTAVTIPNLEYFNDLLIQYINYEYK